MSTHSNQAHHTLPCTQNIARRDVRCAGCCSEAAASMPGSACAILRNSVYMDARPTKLNGTKV